MVPDLKINVPDPKKYQVDLIHLDTPICQKMLDHMYNRVCSDFSEINESIGLNKGMQEGFSFI